MALLDSGGSGGGTVTTTDDSDTTNQGDLINDVRAQVAGYDQDIEESASGAETNDIQVTDTDSGGTVIDPDTSPSSTGDLVGVTSSDDQVAVTTQDGDGGTSTTVTERRTLADDRSPSNTARQAVEQLGVAEPLDGITSWLRENGQVVGAVAAVATLASVAGLIGGD